MFLCVSDWCPQVGNEGWVLTYTRGRKLRIAFFLFFFLNNTFWGAAGYQLETIPRPFAYKP